MADTPPVNSTPEIPVAPPPSGTVDITNLVDSLKSSFITWGDKMAYAELLTVPYAGAFFALPIFSSLAKYGINWVVSFLANSAILAAFFLNTAIRKASQAQDYVDAVTEKNKLPSTATDSEYEHAEQIEMAAFRNFVLVTN